MTTIIRLISTTLASLVILAGCGGGGGGGSPPPPPPPPPPIQFQSVTGTWGGQSVTGAAADVSTSFEFGATGGFTVGATPYTAAFSNGNAETRGDPGLYVSGTNAWHILVGTAATVSFETLPNTLRLNVRTVNAADVSNVDIFDENGVLIQNVIPTNAYQIINITRGAGESLIASVEVTSTSGGDVVIDDLTFGYSGSGFAGSVDDINCLFVEFSAGERLCEPIFPNF